MLDHRIPSGPMVIFDFEGSVAEITLLTEKWDTCIEDCTIWFLRKRLQEIICE